MLYQTSNPHGGEIYTDSIKMDFSASINPLGTPSSVIETMLEAISQADSYPDPACKNLIRAISSHEILPSKYVLCGNGAAELIYTFCQAEKPKKAFIPVPTFMEYETALLPSAREE